MALPFASLKMAPNIGTIGKDLTLIWKTATGNFITGKNIVTSRSSNKNITHTLFQLNKLKIILQSMNIMSNGYHMKFIVSQTQNLKIF